MLPKNPGSIGETPPSTRVNAGRSAAIAALASRTRRAKIDQSLSISKSQCDRLLGSFQIIAASSTSPPAERACRTELNVQCRVVSGAGELAPAADEHLGHGTRDDVEAGAAQHRLRAGAVRDPPVCLVGRVLLLDEMEARKVIAREHAPLREGTVVGDGADRKTAG